MCSLPICASMVGFLFMITPDVPQTETEIYTHFTCLTLKRTINKRPDVDTDDVFKMNNLSSQEKKALNQICKLSLHKTILNKQVLHQNEVDFIHEKYRDMSLGLITIDRTTDLYGFKNIYTFLHLTFQEYLAAYHMSTLSDEEQSMLIQEHGHKIHMKEVWKFYCGLVRDPSIRLREILNTAKLEIIHSIQCVYESQQPSACNVVLDYMNSYLEFKYHHFSTPELSALAYVMANASTPFSLSLYHCDINSRTIGIVLSKHPNYPMLQEFKYYSDRLNQFEVKRLERCLSQFKSVNSLTLSATYRSNSYGLGDIIYPIQAVSTLNLQSITVDPITLKTIISNSKGIQSLTLCDSIESAEVQVLGKYLKHCKELKELDISWNYLVDSDAELLAKSLEFCTSLKTINIRFNNFSNRGVLALLQSLQHCSLVVRSTDIDTNNAVLIDGLKDCTSLQELHFSYTVSHRASANFASHSRNWKELHTLEFTRCLRNNPETLEVSKGLKQLRSLQVLTISENDFSDEGAVELATGISHCTTLRALEFSWNKNVTDRGVAAIAISKNLKNLQELNFSYSKHSNVVKPSTTAITAVVESIQELKNLRILNLGYSKFGDKGAEALSVGIITLHNLEKLSLGGNNITAVGAYPLIQSLRQCPNLIALDLRENTIGTDGSRIISACLIYWSNLQELNLSGDHKLPIIFENIDRQGVLALVENLHHCSQLTKLNLTFNLMGDEGGRETTRLLPKPHLPLPASQQHHKRRYI